MRYIPLIWCMHSLEHCVLVSVAIITDRHNNTLCVAMRTLLILFCRSMASAAWIVQMNSYCHLSLLTPHPHFSPLITTGYSGQIHMQPSIATLAPLILICSQRCCVSINELILLQYYCMCGFQYVAFPPFPPGHDQASSSSDPFVLPKNPIKSRHSSWSASSSSKQHDNKLKKQKSNGPKGKKRHRPAPIVMYIAGDPLTLHSE